MKVKHKLKILMAMKEIKHLTQLSELSGVSYKKLYLFANNKDKFLDPELIVAVCKTLECDIADLLYLEDGQAS